MKVIMKQDRDYTVRRRHPWIFAGAVDSFTGDPAPGDTVEVWSAGKEFLGRGAWSPQSQIRVRMWTYGTDEIVDDGFLHNRLEHAISARTAVDSDSIRLVNAESDDLPGLVVDRFGEWAVCQFLNAGAEFWKSVIVKKLMELLPLRGIYERSDVDVRKKEGLEICTGVLAGQMPPDLIEVRESGYRILVDIKNGHKTGFYLDQRINRLILSQLAADRKWLNCFSYTGAFGLAALSGGARSITNVDTSGPALDIARKSYELNSIDTSKAGHLEADVFSYLRRCRDSGEKFDGIVLDPPKFAESKNQVDGACRGYKDINLLAIKLLNPGGLLFTFSCSGSVDVPLFEKVVASAAMDSGRFVRVLQRLSQAPDHPSCLTFPEGHYLKGLLCSVE